MTFTLFNNYKSIVDRFLEKKTSENTKSCSNLLNKAMNPESKLNINDLSEDKMLEILK